MCWTCHAKAELAARVCAPRRAFLLATAASISAPALAQVRVGRPSSMRALVPAQTLERAAEQEYASMLAQARQQRALACATDPQLRRLRAIAQRLIPQAPQWNPRSRDWRWEVNLIHSKQLNAWCMPGGKIAFYTGILTKLNLSDDETAMIMGHEMAHALREHARERLAKTEVTGAGLTVAASLLGLGDLGQIGAKLGTELLSLKYSRDNETEADLVGLEVAARGGYLPQASVSLWNKMIRAQGGSTGIGFLSSHPSSPSRIQALQASLPQVEGLYLQATGQRALPRSRSNNPVSHQPRTERFNTPIGTAIHVQ